jgi:transketolase
MNNIENPDMHIRSFEKIKDLIDQNIDLILNYRQSGHPGGSRSKVHAFISLLLGGDMRWDIRNPHKRFNDKFVLGAGHTIPMVYATLAVLNESLRIKFKQTNDRKYLVKNQKNWALHWEDLVGFRLRGGLSGHAEMSGKTLFLKFSTGASGHGTAAAAGIALALKRAKAEGVKVFLMEGEGGLTPGVTHEVANSAYGLALDNLYMLIDWNDFGIDGHATSETVYGSPVDWFESHGWKVFGTEEGSVFAQVNSCLSEAFAAENPDHVPTALWFKTRKGRGYLKYDNSSHGSPHGRNSKLFWDTKKEFSDKYDVQFVNYGGEAPSDPELMKKEFSDNLKVVAETLAADQELVDYIAEKLVSLGESVPDQIEGLKIGSKGNPFIDERIYDYRNYPEQLYAKPGEMMPNRAALAKWGAWINAFGAKEYNRPLFVVSSADLSGSTNISGFAEAYGDFKGYGWYKRSGTDEGVLLPQSITEFANTGIMVGMASVNLSENPVDEYDGFWGATSTYGSFSYLTYGMMRIYSQMDQDCDLKLGKAIYVAGHSGPETADDSRTHFGIFAPGVTQLFPEGRIINLYPWEYNEVPVLLAAALKLEKPSIIALHLTRPPVEIPDRAAIGMDSHFEASRGAYLVRDYQSGKPEEGTFYIQGTSAMSNTIKLLPAIDELGLNIKLVYVASPQLFALQDEKYRNKIVSPGDKMNSTLITTSGKKLMPEFTFNTLTLEYTLSPDWDNGWRTGGTLEEVLDEAHLTEFWILEGIKKFTSHREIRLKKLRDSLIF